MDESIGFQQDPKNGHNIKRSRTTGRIRAWEFPRSIDSLDAFRKETGSVGYPGVYVLFQGIKDVYVGEAKDLFKRIKQHLIDPHDGVENWDRLLLINDGRPAAQSDLNDTVIRLSLENYLKELLKENDFIVVSQASRQELIAYQRYIVGEYTKELDVLLISKNIINKLLETVELRKVQTDDLRVILDRRGMQINTWTEKEAIIDGEKYYIRPGSKKPKGWQITFRDRFKDSLRTRNGYLLVNRDGILIIPFNVIRDFFPDECFSNSTIDIFIVFERERVTMLYRNQEIDITRFRLVNEQINNIPDDQEPEVPVTEEIDPGEIIQL